MTEVKVDPSEPGLPSLVDHLKSFKARCGVLAFALLFLLPNNLVLVVQRHLLCLLERKHAVRFLAHDLLRNRAVALVSALVGLSLIHI